MPVGPEDIRRYALSLTTDNKAAFLRKQIFIAIIAAVFLVAGMASDMFDPKSPRFIYLFDKQGRKTWQKELDGKDYETGLKGPIVRISDDGGILCVQSVKDISVSKVEEVVYEKI